MQDDQKPEVSNEGGKTYGSIVKKKAKAKQEISPEKLFGTIKKQEEEEGIIVPLYEGGGTMVFNEEEAEEVRCGSMEIKEEVVEERPAFM